MEPRVRVYVAGPYTRGDVGLNVRNAIMAADTLYAHGFAPYVPHLTHFWHLVSPRCYEDWMDLDMVWLRQCECLLRLPGKSEGAEREIVVARGSGIPVFRSITEVIKHYDESDS